MVDGKNIQEASRRDFLRCQMKTRTRFSAERRKVIAGPPFSLLQSWLELYDEKSSAANITESGEQPLGCLFEMRVSSM